MRSYTNASPPLPPLVEETLCAFVCFRCQTNSLYFEWVSSLHCTCCTCYRRDQKKKLGQGRSEHKGKEPDKRHTRSRLRASDDESPACQTCDYECETDEERRVGDVPPTESQLAH